MSIEKTVGETLKQIGAWQQKVRREFEDVPDKPRVMVKKVCGECHQEFETFDCQWVHLVNLCPDCQDRKTIGEQPTAQGRLSPADRDKDRDRMWLKLCPLAFHDFDPSRLPDVQAFNQVIAWQFNPQGLILHGPTRTGKTRCCWQLLKLMHRQGRSLKVMDCGTALEYGAIYGESTQKVAQWMATAETVNILVFDDVFKSKLSDSFESALFTLVNRRLEHRRPLIVTTNDTGLSLSERMTEDRGLPIIERLREACSTIQFRTASTK